MRHVPLVARAATAYLSSMTLVRSMATLARPSRLAAWAMAVLIGLLAAVAAPAGAQQDMQTFTRDRLSIATAAGQLADFDVELALTPEQRAQGLMYRRELPADAGMLFVYDKEWEIAMWMKNTVIPLDMLFLTGDGRIVKIAERTVPFSLETISSEQPVAGVLEVNGGTVARLGIRRGDRVLHSAFTGAP